jgi:hypothetical protein
MSAQPTPDRPRSARATIRSYIRDVIEGEHDIDRQDVIETCRTRFLADPDFARAVCEEAIDLIVPEILNNMMGHQRADTISTALGWVRGDSVERTAKERFERIFEGTGTGYRSILWMRKADGEQALQRRLDQINGHNRFVGFWRETLPRMDNEHTVGETFDSKELERLWQRHFS